MHWKLAVTLVLVTVGLTQSQPEQGGELLPRWTTVRPGGLCGLPTIEAISVIRFTADPENRYFETDEKNNHIAVSYD